MKFLESYLISWLLGGGIFLALIIYLVFFHR